VTEVPRLVLETLAIITGQQPMTAADRAYSRHGAALAFTVASVLCWLSLPAG
jgi:hypothetical protein